MNVWLVGMMGSGKSEVGRRLASKMGAPFVDLDAQLETEAGRPISRIFREDGEPAFRKMEQALLARVAKRRDAVIATGGGAVLSPANRRAMRESGTVVWLDAPPATLAARIGGDGARPLLEGGDPAATLAKIAGERDARYRDAAHLRVSSDARDADAVADEVMATVRGTRVTLPGGGEYRVRVGFGLLDGIGAVLREALGDSGSEALVVTDSNVGRRHGARAEKALARGGWKPTRITIAAGERHKTLATVAKIWEAALAAGADRRTPIVALGGGVVGDLAGFAAATLLRGVPLMQVPTTLVAAVDSAIGGKTGFDLRGKNRVGALKHPVAVVADLALLETLPRRELVAGMGEVVKYGAIADAALLERLRKPLGEELVSVVRRCVEIKAGVVSRDPEERGERVVLNFGHTIGHALEAAGAYRRWRHGEAVAIGLVAETRFAEERGVCRPGESARLAEVLVEQGLPIGAPGASFRRAVPFVAADKKRTRGELSLPLLREAGRVEVQRVPVVEVMRFVSKLS